MYGDPDKQENIVYLRVLTGLTMQEATRLYIEIVSVFRNHSKRGYKHEFDEYIRAVNQALSFGVKIDISNVRSFLEYLVQTGRMPKF